MYVVYDPEYAAHAVNTILIIVIGISKGSAATPCQTVWQGGDGTYTVYLTDTMLMISL